MELQFITVTPSDFPAVLEMMQAFNSIDGYPFDPARCEMNLREFILHPHYGRIWLLSSEGQRIGYVVLAFGFSFEHGGKDAIIDELYLKEDFRGRGFGKLIMVNLENLAMQLDVKKIHLEVETTNERGYRLYHSCGFRENGRKLLSKEILI